MSLRSDWQAHIKTPAVFVFLCRISPDRPGSHRVSWQFKAQNRRRRGGSLTKEEDLMMFHSFSLQRGLKNKLQLSEEINQFQLLISRLKCSCFKHEDIKHSSDMHTRTLARTHARTHTHTFYWTPLDSSVLQTLKFWLWINRWNIETGSDQKQNQ